MNESLEQGVYIVTGASRGFGLAIAEALVAAGACVGLIGRDIGTLEPVVARLGAERAFAAQADVGDAAAIGAAIAAVKQHFGRLDGLINNAGMARPGSAETLVPAEARAQIETNFLGTVFATQAAIPLLRGAPNPRIVNISSASAFHMDEMSQLSIYAASKAAVERYTRDLRRELQADGIGVTILRAGSAPTGFAAGWDMGRFEAAIDAWQRAGNTMDVGMETQHVAATILWCLRCPPGVSVDLLEVRPSAMVPKPDFKALMGG